MIEALWQMTFQRKYILHFSRLGEKKEYFSLILLDMKHSVSFCYLLIILQWFVNKALDFGNNVFCSHLFVKVDVDFHLKSTVVTTCV